MTALTPAFRARSASRPIEGQEIALLAVITVLWLALGFATDTFFTGSNLRAILFNVAPIALIGIGMTAVIVTAGIDVSVGSAVAVVMVVVAKLIRDVGLPAPAAVGVALALGALLGLVNGGLVAFGRIHPIIVTFATLNIFRFVALRIFDNRQVTGMPDTLAFAGGGAAGRIAGLPNAWLAAVVLAAAMWWYMRAWPTGRHLYAIGGDVLAARLAGVRVRRRQIFAYVLTGALVGLAGCVLIGSGGLVSQNAGEGLELQAIAAVVIGGTSIVGGRGSVLGTMLGALLVGTVTSAVTLLGWRSELTTLFVGIFILVAVGVDLVRARRREAR
jgi:ribose transport system permease protein